MKNFKVIGFLLLALTFSFGGYSQDSVAPPSTATVKVDTIKAADVTSSDSVTLKTTDSSKVVTVSANDITAPSDVTFLGFKIPAWVLNVIMALLTILPAVQVVLKRIPTEISIKIGGIIGKILDILTWFQKDNVPPPPNETVKKT